MPVGDLRRKGVNYYVKERQPNNWMILLAMCVADNSRLNRAAIKCRQRINLITAWSLLVPVFIMCTTDSLSQWH